eukprot:TRINITY_DN76655_c0_g1_i1.p1 TRINITY_DN76655_c0_g1~~TRINITY_DN76655_c0_g1_i1.p1  ORF type:complete len:514 (+),score=40.18 TRINITY_DN76655_c0_g1_i1:49-1542(+)
MNFPAAPPCPVLASKAGSGASGAAQRPVFSLLSTGAGAANRESSSLDFSDSSCSVVPAALAICSMLVYRILCTERPSAGSRYAATLQGRPTGARSLAPDRWRQIGRRGSSAPCRQCSVVACRSGDEDPTDDALGFTFASGTERSVSASKPSPATPLTFDDALQSPAAYKLFLAQTEEARPDWYRLTDLYLTIVGALCFYIEVVKPSTAATYYIREIEDFINVTFLVKFVLLLWANDFRPTWFLTGRALLDAASCLPVLEIAARAVGSPSLEKSLEILQLFRFTRLLGLSLPRRRDDGSVVSATDGLQLLTVLLSLFGTVGVSATLLFSYENPRWMEGIAPFRSFDDTVLYMVDVFAGRQLPFEPRTSGGKQVTALSTLVGILFLPFLVSVAIELFRANEVKETAKKSEEQRSGYWARVLRRLDVLEDAGFLTAGECGQLREACMEGDAELEILELAYGDEEFDREARGNAWVAYATALRQFLAYSRKAKSSSVFATP